MAITDALALPNLLAWNIQIALIVAAAATVIRLLDVAAPVIRHTAWRIVLIVCLLLPAIQPRQTAAIASLATESIEAPAATFTTTVMSRLAPSWQSRTMRVVRERAADWIAVLLVAGMSVRLLWLAAGIFRLRRLRHAGDAIVPDGGYAEVASLIDAGAEIRYVNRIGQPVTFGVVRPIVLLPSAFPSLPDGIRQAILAHELWHVRRRDWIWVLVEETIRAAFWFNPAMGWLVSRVQTSREEVIDELTVQVTNARRTYIEAMLAFADNPVLFPAAPFARRRHLFERMVLISREAVMSSRRIVVSSLALVGAVIGTGWYGATAFPLAATTVAAPAGQTGQATPRDRRPGEAAPETTRERELKAQIASGGAPHATSFELARLQEARLAWADAQQTLENVRAESPQDRDALTTLAAFYNRSGQFDKTIATLEEVAALSPSDPQGYQVLATFYWEKAFKDPSLQPAQKKAYVQSGIAATDRALAADSNYSDAMVYKNILLRMQANMETDAAKRQALVAEADALKGRALELTKARSQRTGEMTFVPKSSLGQDGAPPPPPPPPPPIDGMAPVRIGGNIRPPVKVRDVKPIYPPEARDAGIQGVVIMEISLDTAGNIATARVLRGVPMLDQAALDAVRQWQFEPTQLNGAPTPVMMTVTVNFSLQ